MRWIPDDAEVQYRDLATWSPTPWHTRGGRVTLAGDAAHVMVTYSHRGLENSITDANNFVEAVRGIITGKRVRAEAIPSYSREVAARGAEEVELSRKAANARLDASVGGSGLRGHGPCSDRADTVSKRQSSSPTGRGLGRRALSVCKAWTINTIENLDRGAKQGTAQTGWVETGWRGYGRRHFPQD